MYDKGFNFSEWGKDYTPTSESVTPTNTNEDKPSVTENAEEDQTFAKEED